MHADPTLALSGVATLLQPEVATIFSAVIAVTSVGLNLYGSLLTERRKAEIQIEFERERAALEQQNELRSVLARYRGPLLEATIDLEQRIYHLLALPPECSMVCEEEVLYTLFTLAQFLGFVEVVRREGPRERTFLHPGNSQGSDTLAALVEAFRFVMCAHVQQLHEWYEDGEQREHPGARPRKQVNLEVECERGTGLCRDVIRPASAEPAVQGAAQMGAVSQGGAPLGGVGSAARGGQAPAAAAAAWSGAFRIGQEQAAGGAHAASSNGSSNGQYSTAAGSGNVIVQASASSSGVQPDQTGVPELRDGCRLDNAFRLSRGMQRAIGAMVNVTPIGARRHYTISYADFFQRFRTDPYFAGWFKPLYEDVIDLVNSGQRWLGQGPFPFNRWTRLLLLQQLLIDAIDLLDPLCVRMPATKRVRLSSVAYGPLPNVESYLTRISQLEEMIDTGGIMQRQATQSALLRPPAAAVPPAAGQVPLGSSNPGLSEAMDTLGTYDDVLPGPRR